MLEIIGLEYVQPNEEFTEIAIEVVITDQRKEKFGLERTIACIRKSADEFFDGGGHFKLWNGAVNDRNTANLDCDTYPECVEKFEFTVAEENMLNNWISKNVKVNNN